LNNTKIKVGIICPLDDEYNSCKEILGMKNESELSGRIISERKENNIEVYAIKAGIGKINCSSATQLVIDKYQTDFVIDAGVAGSLTKDLNIFDIVCPEHSYEYDPSSGKELGKIPSEDDESHTVINDPFYKKVFQEFSEHIQETMAINIRIGNVACGEKDVKTRQLRRELHENFNGLVCNWETSAVLSVANLNKVKAISFRVISDLADEDMKESFDANCKPALQKMFPILEVFIFGGWIQKFY
jgi:adenosylhomocysteine nucleosidase